MTPFNYNPRADSTETLPALRVNSLLARHGGEHAVPPEQFVECPLLHDAPGGQDDDAVHFRERGQPVRDAYHRAVFFEPVNRGLHLRLGLRIDDAVASSSTSNGALRTNARAMASRWRWPPDKVTPFSPMKVS